MVSQAVNKQRRIGMRSQTIGASAVTVSGFDGSAGASANSSALRMNQGPVPFNAAFQVIPTTTSGATVTFSVQHCFEGVSAGTTWFDHSEVSGQTANIDGNIAFPVNAVRLRSSVASAVSAASSGQTSAKAMLTVIQQGY